MKSERSRAKLETAVHSLAVVMDQIDPHVDDDERAELEALRAQLARVVAPVRLVEPATCAHRLELGALTFGCARDDGHTGKHESSPDLFGAQKAWW